MEMWEKRLSHFNSIETYIHPIDVRLEVINGMRQKFDITLTEMLFVHSNSTQFGGTHWSKVTGMRKKHNPPANYTKKNGIYECIALNWIDDETWIICNEMETRYFELEIHF